MRLGMNVRESRAGGHLRRLLAAILVLVGVLAASAQAPGPETLSIGVGYDTALFDQLRTATAPMAAHAIFETLVSRDDNGTYHPHLAESWEYDEDGLAVTFTLREGLTFHDGTPLDAAAVKWYYDRARDPQGEHTQSGSYSAVTSIVVVDDLTVRFEFDTPFATLFDVIGTPQFAGIISPTAYEAAGEEYGVSVVVGSGPYRLERWVPSDVTVLRRVLDYDWAPPHRAANPGPAHIETLVYRILPEPGTAVAALETGQIDVLYGVPVQDYPRLADAGRFNFFTAPTFGGALIFVYFNFDNEAFQDLRVRQAMSHAIDREGMVAALYADIAAEPAFSFLPAHFPASYPEAEAVGYSFDPERARALLEDAGWRPGAGGVRERNGQRLVLDLPIWTWPDHLDVGQVIKANLAAVGVEVNILPSELSASVALAQAGQFDLWQGLWGWAFPDVMYNFLHSSGANNFGGIDDPELDAYLEQAVSAATIEESNAAYQRADRRVAEQALVLPIVFRTDIVAVHERVQDFAIDPLGFHNFPTDWSLSDAPR
jgi:peptide/nickel transport system substrate-binding protein